jgi:hypothetical protein
VSRQVSFVDIAILVVATFAALVTQQVDIQSLDQRVAKIEQQVKNAK